MQSLSRNKLDVFKAQKEFCVVVGSETVDARVCRPGSLSFILIAAF